MATFLLELVPHIQHLTDSQPILAILSLLLLLLILPHQVLGLYDTIHSLLETPTSTLSALSSDQN